MFDRWREVELKDVAQPVMDPLRPGVRADLPYVALEHVMPGSPRVPVHGTSADTVSTTMRFQQGDVLFSKLRPYLNKVAVAEGEGCCTGEILVWRTRDKAVLLPAYLALVLRDSRAIHHAVTMSAGSRMPRTSAAQMSSFKFLISPLEEQQRIVDLIGALENAIEAADDRSGAAAELLSDLQGAIPDGVSVAVGDVLDGIDNGVTTKSSDQINGNGLQSLVKASAVLPANFRPSEVKPMGSLPLPEITRVREGDLLMTRINTPERVGFICIARNVPPGLYRPDLVWRLRFDERRVLHAYVEHVMASRAMRALVSAAASGTSRSMQQISKGRFAAVPMTLPPLELQEKYVAICDSARTNLQAAVNLASSLRALRSELLGVLLSGEHQIPESYDVDAAVQLESTA